MRVLLMTLAAGLALSGCATRPQVAHEGDLSPLKGQAVMSASAYRASQAAPTGTDAALAKTVEAGVARRLARQGTIDAGVVAPRYLLQVAVATSPGEVGMSTGVGPQVGVAPWRGAPVKRHFWNRRGPVRTATLSVLDLSSGKVVAWSSVRAAGANAEDLANRLVAALGETKA